MSLTDIGMVALLVLLIEAILLIWRKLDKDD